MRFAPGIVWIAIATTSTAPTQPRAAPPSAETTGIPSAPAETRVIERCIGPVICLRYSPDGRALTRICQFGPAVEIFSTADDTVRTFSVGMRMLAYNPGGSLIATAEGNDGARVWDATDEGRPLAGQKRRSLIEHPVAILQQPGRDARERVFWADFSPDGSRLLTAHANGHVKVWAIKTWTLERDLSLVDEPVLVARFAPDGKTIVIGDVKGGLHEWSFETNAEAQTTHTSGAVTGIVFAPGGKTLVTSHQFASGDSSVTIWDWANRVARETKTGLTTAAISADGKMLALGGKNIELVDPESGRRLRTIELEPLTLGEVNPDLANSPRGNAKFPVKITSLSFSPDGRTLAAGLVDGTARLVDLSR